MTKQFPLTNDFQMVIKYEVYKDKFVLRDFYDVFIDEINKRVQLIPSYDYFKDKFDNKTLQISCLESADLSGDLASISGTSVKTDIKINSNFLAVLWCICFNSLIEFDSQKSQTTESIRDETNALIGDYETDAARQLLNFALQEVRSAKDEWGSYRDSWHNALLPNPFIIEISLKDYILKSNAIFIEAVVFIILHELGHYYYDNIDKDGKHEYEICSDFFAAYEREQSVDKSDGCAYYLGMITSFIAIELIQQISGTTGDSDTHPSNITRIDKIINFLILPDDSNIYGYCAYGLQRLYPYKPQCFADGYHYETASGYYSDALKNAVKMG